MTSDFATITIATHNMGDRPDPSILDDIFGLSVGVLCLQEVADQPQTTWRRRAGDHIEWYWPEKPDGEKSSQNIDENPICWDRRVAHFYKSGSVHLSDPKEVGEVGPGSSVMHHKWLNWVTLLELDTNRRFTVGNMHTVPSPQLPKRQSLMDEQMHGAVKWAEKRPDPRVLFLNGDLNSNYKDPDERKLLRPLWNAGFESCWEVTGAKDGSFGNEQLDYINLRKNNRAKMTDIEVPDLGFDHKPVLVDVKFRDS